MDVTVIVPLFDKARWVQRALDSIARQTYARFEVLVVDDGSTDGGGDVALAHAYRDPRFRLLRQQNAGPGAARNAGAALARGRLLAFLDADDEWAPTFLEEAVLALEANPRAAAVTFGHKVVPGDAARQRAWRKRRLPYGPYQCHSGTPAAQLLHVLAFLSPCATVLRRDVFLRLGGFFAEDRCGYGEDAWLFLRLLLTEPVVLLPERRVTFHLDASGLSHNHRGARPVEPFLLHPARVGKAVRAEMRPLLRELLAIRASKTACMLAFWGRRREAVHLLERYAGDRRLFQPWSLRAALAGSVLGHLAAAVARWVPAVRRLAARRHVGALPAQALPVEAEIMEVPAAQLLPAAAPPAEGLESFADLAEALADEITQEVARPAGPGPDSIAAAVLGVVEAEASSAEILAGLPPAEHARRRAAGTKPLEVVPEVPADGAKGDRAPG